MFKDALDATTMPLQSGWMHEKCLFRTVNIHIMDRFGEVLTRSEFIECMMMEDYERGEDEKGNPIWRGLGWIYVDENDDGIMLIRWRGCGDEEYVASCPNTLIG
jgi:hypothetical protein